MHASPPSRQERAATGPLPCATDSDAPGREPNRAIAAAIDDLTVPLAWQFPPEPAKKLGINRSRQVLRNCLKLQITLSCNRNRVVNNPGVA